MYQNKEDDGFLSIFSNSNSFKQLKSSYISKIVEGNPKNILTISLSLKKIFESQSIKPESRLLALYFLKEAIDCNIGDFLIYVKKLLYPLLLKDAKFKKDVQDDDRGKYFFSSDPDKTLKVKGNSYLRYLLECIEVWSKWYKNDTVFVEGYRGLVKEGVKFPSERTYLKNVDENAKEPIYINKKEPSVDLDTPAIYKTDLNGKGNTSFATQNGFHEDSFIHEANQEFLIKKKNNSIENVTPIIDHDLIIQLKERFIRLKNKINEDLFLEKETSFIQVSQTMQTFKTLLTEIESLIEKFPDVTKSITKEKGMIQVLLISFNSSIRNDEKNFESLKAAFTNLFLEKPVETKKNLNLSPNSQLLSPLTPLRSPFLFPLSPIQTSQNTLDLQDLRTNLLSSREIFKENLPNYLNKWTNMPNLHTSLIKFAADIIKEPSEKALTRYLSLCLVKVLMDTNDISAVVPENVTQFLLEPLIQIAKFNYSSKEPAEIRFSGFFGRTSNETIEEIAFKFVSLAIQCIYDWGTDRSLPSETKIGEKTKFLEAFEGLRDLGVGFGFVNQGDASSLLLKKKNNDAHLKEINRYREELKNFLQKSKKQPEEKRKEFLSKMNENLLVEAEFLNKTQINSDNSQTEDALKFLKEFKKRYKKYMENNITYVQFKKRFLKFFGIVGTELSSSKISSKISTSDIAPNEKPSNSFNINNGFLDVLGPKSPIKPFSLDPKMNVLNKIPQMPLPQKNYQINLYPKISYIFKATSLLSEPEILNAFQELKSKSPDSVTYFAGLCKKYLEDFGDESYLLPLNILLVIQEALNQNDERITQIIHDYILKSLIDALLICAFENKKEKGREGLLAYQQQFLDSMLKSLKNWAFKYKSNLFLGSFKNAWNLIIEDLMMDIPEGILDKSNDFSQIRTKEFPSFVQKEEKLSFKVRKASFLEIFEEKTQEKIQLKGFGKMNKRENEKEKMKIKEEVRILKENIELKRKIREKEEEKKRMEKEISQLKEKLKVYENGV